MRNRVGIRPHQRPELSPSGASRWARRGRCQAAPVQVSNSIPDQAYTIQCDGKARLAGRLLERVHCPYRCHF